MSLSAKLLQLAKQTTSDDQGDWRQFILDHLDYIAARCMTYAIEPEVMNLYRYDLDRFLKDRMNRHADIAWIVKLLNNLPNDLSFDTAGDFLIPTDSLIQKLFHSYTSIKANPV